MKMAKASEADLRMAMGLASMLESFERGYFPPSRADRDDEESDDFCIDLGSHCQSAMNKILDKLRDGSLYRVVLGMAVLLDPKNKVVDPDKDYIDHHPETIRAREMHDELVEALRSAERVLGSHKMQVATLPRGAMALSNQERELASLYGSIRAILAKVDQTEDR